MPTQQAMDASADLHGTNRVPLRRYAQFYVLGKKLERALTAITGEDWDGRLPGVDIPRYSPYSPDGTANAGPRTDAQVLIEIIDGWKRVIALARRSGVSFNDDEVVET